MSKMSKIIAREYGNAYDFKVKKQYSEPVIYDANGDLKKRWYVYYSFRNPKTDKLERQTPVYAGVNAFKNLSERKRAIEVVRKAISGILKNGYNPFDDSSLPIDQHKNLSIPQAVKLVLDFKEKTLKESSFKDFKSRINQFKNWLLDNGYQNRYISAVNKKAVIEYLNFVTLKSSAQNRNNTRSNLSIFFQKLEDDEIIPVNFISKINVIKTRPERNKSYTSVQENDIFELLKEIDKELLLFIQFISYNFLRPIEVCRLKIKDIDLVDNRIYVRAKNAPVKTKIIPSAIYELLPDLSKFEKEAYLFTADGFGKSWETDETNKRDYFSKRFKKVVKKPFGLGKDYGLYSFRHTFITKLYNELLNDSTPFEAKSKLMLITGHTTMSALEKYLRDIDAVLPDDYSHLIKKSAEKK